MQKPSSNSSERTRNCGDAGSGVGRRKGKVRNGDAKGRGTCHVERIWVGAKLVTSGGGGKWASTAALDSAIS